MRLPTLSLPTFCILLVAGLLAALALAMPTSGRAPTDNAMAARDALASGRHADGAKVAATDRPGLETMATEMQVQGSHAKENQSLGLLMLAGVIFTVGIGAMIVAKEAD